MDNKPVSRAKLDALRENAAALALVPMVAQSDINQALFELIAALEGELARPYDEAWFHTIPELAKVLGLNETQHPGNVIGEACAVLNRYAEAPS